MNLEHPSQQISKSHCWRRAGGGVRANRKDDSVDSLRIPTFIDICLWPYAASNMPSASCPISVSIEDVEQTLKNTHHWWLMGAAKRARHLGASSQRLLVVWVCVIVSVKMRSWLANGCGQSCTERVESLSIEKLGDKMLLYILQVYSQYREKNIVF